MQYIDKNRNGDFSRDVLFVMCLGNFDGVHIGHRHIFTKALEIKNMLSISNKQIKIGVFTFLDLPTKGTKPIFPFEEKKKLIFEMGADAIFAFSFDEIKDLAKEEFVNSVLKNRCQTIYCVCGENFKFAKNASANANDLYYLTDSNTSIVPLLDYEGEIISSSKIKSLLNDGNVETANKLLGKDFFISDEVSHGKELGRKLGFPTANILFPNDVCELKNGIYATKINVDSKDYFSVSNVGLRPTVENTNIKNIETFVFDFDKDIYGKKITVSFCKKLRDEIKFASTDELKKQISIDKENAKEYFKRR